MERAEQREQDERSVVGGHGGNRVGVEGETIGNFRTVNGPMFSFNVKTNAHFQKRSNDGNSPRNYTSDDQDHTNPNHEKSHCLDALVSLIVMLLECGVRSEMLFIAFGRRTALVNMPSVLRSPIWTVFSEQTSIGC